MLNSMAICYAASLAEQILVHTKLSDMVLGMASLLANYKPPFSSRCSLSMTENQAEALCVPVSTAKSWQRWGKKGREGGGGGGGGGGGEGGGGGGKGRERETYLSQP